MLRGGRNTFIITFTILIFGTFFVGCSPIFVRWSEIGPIATAFYRVMLAFPLFVGIYFWEIKFDFTEIFKSKLRLRDYISIVLAGIFFAGDLTFWHLSIVNTSIANATFLATLAPIYVTLGLFLLYGEKPKKIFLLGIFFAFLGAVLLIGDSFSIKPQNLKGDLYGIVTGMFFAAYILAIRCARLRQSTAFVMTWSTLISAILLLVLTLMIGENLQTNTLNGWLVLLALAVVSQFAGQGLIASALLHLPTSFSSVTLTMEAVFAAILAWIVFNEPLDLWQWFGAAIIIIGIFVSRKGSGKA